MALAKIVCSRCGFVIVDPVPASSDADQVFSCPNCHAAVSLEEHPSPGIDNGAADPEPDAAEVTAGSDALILAAPPHPGQQRSAALLVGVGLLIVSAVGILSKVGLPQALLAVILLAGTVPLFSGMRLVLRAAGVSQLSRKQTENALRRLKRGGMLILLPEEQMERVALTQCGQSSRESLLIVFSTHRLLLHFLDAGQVARIEQIPYQAMREVRLIAAVGVTVGRKIAVKLEFSGQSRNLTLSSPVAERVVEEFRLRSGRLSEVAPAELCLCCLQPFKGDSCGCAGTLPHDLRAVWLSALFPGLGQIRNGQPHKALVFLFLGLASLLTAMLWLKGWWFDRAPLTPDQKVQIINLTIMAPIWYLVNIVDAYRSSQRKRKRA